MEVIGKLKYIGATTQVSATFSKREVVVVTNEQYPQSILIEFSQDKCSILDNYQVGQDVTVSINLRGREWVNPQGETRYFNSIQGWFIKNNGSQQTQAPQPTQQHQNASAPTFTPPPVDNGDDSDLPF